MFGNDSGSESLKQRLLVVVTDFVHVATLGLPLELHVVNIRGRLFKLISWMEVLVLIVPQLLQLIKAF